MKQRGFTFLLTMLTCMTGIKSSANSFAVENEDGVNN